MVSSHQVPMAMLLRHRMQKDSAAHRQTYSRGTPEELEARELQMHHPRIYARRVQSSSSFPPSFSHSFPFISICPALSAKARRLENRGAKTDRRELTIELSHLCRVKDSKTVKIFHEDKKRIGLRKNRGIE
ncbi:unnamed protein product [Lasius platythorax]|uniref:Uncharacterized protein n=1 Tax=Lasius platythorax TaxID=488582 RepID=A0AAV2NUG2_9HYME